MNPSPARILLADDEPPLLKMMCAYLTRIGFSVAAVATTAEAWAAVEREPAGYGVAVLDATMNGISLDVLARKMLTASPGLHLLVCSGYLVEMNGLETFAPGRVGFLHKPFTPEMLAKAVRGMIGSKEESL